MKTTQIHFLCMFSTFIMMKSKKMRKQKAYFIMVVQFNPIQDGTFQGCSWMGVGKNETPPPSLKSLTHILQL